MAKLWDPNIVPQNKEAILTTIETFFEEQAQGSPMVIAKELNKLLRAWTINSHPMAIFTLFAKLLPDDVANASENKEDNDNPLSRKRPEPQVEPSDPQRTLVQVSAITQLTEHAHLLDVEVLRTENQNIPPWAEFGFEPHINEPRRSLHEYRNFFGLRDSAILTLHLQQNTHKKDANLAPTMPLLDKTLTGVVLANESKFHHAKHREKLSAHEKNIAKAQVTRFISVSYTHLTLPTIYSV